jgi:hypothetical protein
LEWWNSERIKLVGGTGLRKKRNEAEIKKNKNLREWNTLIDTGSDFSLISLEKLKSMKGFLKENKNINLVAVNGERIKSYGTSIINFYIGKSQFEEKFVVVEDDCLLLGWNFLSENGIAILPKEKMLTHMGKTLIGMVETDGNQEKINNISDITAEGSRGRTSPNKEQPDDRKSCMTRFFLGDKEVFKEEAVKVNEVETPKTNGISVQEGTLDPESRDTRDREDLETIFREYKEAFSGNVKGEVKHDVKCKIELTEHAKKAILYKVPMCYREEVDEDFREKERLGIVEKSKAERISPLVVVKKDNGKIRVCVDFRQLNKVTIPNNYPIPRIAEILQKARGKIFSSIDLKDAFYQIPMEDESAELTAVQTTSNTYQFKRMPMGLRNASATFQRLMDEILRGMEYAVGYIDDILVFSNNRTEHLKHINEIMKRLTEFGMTINGQKSKFLCDKITFLGFEISESGYRPASKFETKKFDS